MTDIKQFLRRVDDYIAASGRAQSTVSRKLFGGGARLGELRDGSNIWPETLARASERLAELERVQQLDRAA